MGYDPEVGIPHETRICIKRLHQTIGPNTEFD